MNADQFSIKVVALPQILNKYIFNRPPQAPLQMLNKYLFNRPPLPQLQLLPLLPPLPLLQLLPLLPHSVFTRRRLFPSLERRAVCLYDSI